MGWKRLQDQPQRGAPPSHLGPEGAREEIVLPRGLENERVETGPALGDPLSPKASVPLNGDIVSISTKTRSKARMPTPPLLHILPKILALASRLEKSVRSTHIKIEVKAPPSAAIR